MTDAGEEFVRFREHIAARDGVKAELQELQIQYARLSASLLHLPDKVDKLTVAVNALTLARMAPQETQPRSELVQLLAAMQQPKSSAMSMERWLLLAAFGGAGWMAARFFIGG